MKITNVLNITEDVLIVGGVAIGISQIESILGITLLAVQLCLIIYKGVALIVKHIKNKDYKSAIKQGEQTLEDVKDTLEKSGIVNKENGKDSK